MGRCSGNCNPTPANAGPGSFILSGEAEASAPAVDTNFVNIAQPASFSANAGDNLIAWANPVVNLGTGLATAAIAQIRLNGVLQNADDQTGEGIDGDGNAMPVLARIVIPSGGTHTVSLWVAAANNSIDSFGGNRIVFMVFRPL